MGSPPDAYRRERLQKLLEKALELPAELRRAFLKTESSDDPSLRAEVEALLEPTAAERSGETFSTSSETRTQEGTVAQAAAGPTSTAGEPLRRWGDLEIRRELGTGHFGKVYLCHDPSLDRDVALKLYRRSEPSGRKSDPRARVLARIEREGRLLARVHHPNVLRVYGVGTHDGEVGLWMEYVRGQTLEELLQGQGRFGAREASVICAALCAALAAVHAEGVIHRDVKAQNVLREEGGRIILMDFGAGHDLVQADLHHDASGVGTPIYMAPETLAGAQATVQSDIYSLGVLLFYLVSRSFPVRTGSRKVLLQKHESGDLILLRDLRPDLPARFVRVVEKALAADPGQRFASAGQMQAALEAASDLGSEAGFPADPSLTDAPATVRHIRRTASVMTWLGIGATALALLTFLGFVTSNIYRISLSIPAEFVSDSLQDYVLWGGRAMIPALFLAAVGIAVLVGFWWLLRLVGWVLRRLHTATALVERLASAGRAISDANRASLLRWTLGMGTVGLAAAFFSQQPILDAMWNVASEEASRTADYSILRSDAVMQHNVYTGVFGMLMGAVALSTARALVRDAAKGIEGSRWVVAGIAALLIVTAGFVVAPWRLLWDNNLDVIECTQADSGETRLGFVVATLDDVDECRSWIFYPDTYERRSMPCVETLSANGCRRTGRNEYLFGGSYNR